MENPNKKDYNVDEQNKIYIIGGKGVGKTSLFHLIFSNKFKEDIKPSNIGIMKSNYKSGEKIFTIKDLTDDEVAALRAEIDKHLVEGDLRREVAMNIKNKMEINSYQGSRHKKGLPVRGQRTRTNARTRKGKPKTIANKKK